MDLDHCPCGSSGSPHRHEHGLPCRIPVENPSISGESSTQKSHVASSQITRILSINPSSSLGKAIMAPTRHRLEQLDLTSRVTHQTSKKNLGKALAPTCYQKTTEPFKGVALKTPSTEVMYILRGVHFEPPAVTDHVIPKGVPFEPPSVEVVYISRGVHFDPPSVKDHVIFKPEKGILFSVNNRSLVFSKDSDHG